jgi:hypothetical protein
MTTKRISRQDLDSLATKIATLDLTEHEQSVLLAVFAIAFDSVGRTLPDIEVKRAAPAVAITQDGELPDLTTIFDQAFAPSVATAGGGGDDNSDEVVVTFGKIGR